MLHLDITGVLGKTITPAMGIPDQELGALRTTMKRHIEAWLQEREKGEHGWSMNWYDKAAIQRVKESAMLAKGKGIQTVIWIGIGGSGLGPKVIQEALETAHTLEFFVVDTIDPFALQSLIETVDWKTTLVVVASKSGDTLETMSAFFLCFAELQKHNKKRAGDHVIAITDPEKGHLRDFSLEHDIRMLPLPADVGGRYSIFTPIGMLAIALLDGDVNAFCRGAKEMDTICQKTLMDENPAALLACVQFLLDTKRDYPVRVIMPYCHRLQSLARWNQQLIAESLGKQETANPIPLAAVGTQDQHSLLQQWMAGPRKTWHIFIREKEKVRLTVPAPLPEFFAHLEGKAFGQLLDACAEGTARALTSAKRPHVTLTITRVDSQHLGQLFYLFLTEVVLLGKLYRIDPYGQPAVEIGKKITKEILSKGRNA